MNIRRIILLICFPFMVMPLKGQVNHVLNFGFAQYSSCNGIGGCAGSAVTNWYAPTINSLNWFSTCYGMGTAGVPQNLDGYQFARTGESYSNITFSEINHIRTYITGTFSDSLIATKKYCVTFYVSLGDSSWYAISGIGAHLSNDSICEPNSYDTVLHYTPQIENPSNNILTDKIDWVPISAEYTAGGGNL